jgi:hypothetical protein
LTDRSIDRSFDHPRESEEEFGLGWGLNFNLFLLLEFVIHHTFSKTRTLFIIIAREILNDIPRDTKVLSDLQWETDIVTFASTYSLYWQHEAKKIEP